MAAFRTWRDIRRHDRVELNKGRIKLSARARRLTEFDALPRLSEDLMARTLGPFAWPPPVRQEDGQKGKSKDFWDLS